MLVDIEATPVLLIRFTRESSERLVRLVQHRFKEEGLLIHSTVIDSVGRHVLILTSTQRAIEEQAERIHLMKQTTDLRVVDYFTVEQRKRFCIHEGAGYLDPHGLFSSAERTMLVFHLLNNITVLPHGRGSTELSELLDRDYRADYHTHNDVDRSITSVRQKASLTRRLREHGEESVCLRHVLQTYGLIDAVVPTHSNSIREEILKKTWWPLQQLKPPVHDIQQYYGWEVAFYFAWMGFLTSWLIFPGILGLVVSVLRWYRHDTIDEDEYTPFYGLITYIWAVLFLRFWERHEHRLAYQWGTYSLTSYERQKFFATRPEFKGFVRESPITGDIEVHYPAVRRRLKFVFSFVVTVALLGVAFTVMVISLNLQGYIRPKSNPTRWTEKSPHPFHFASVAYLAEEGQVFDAKSSWRSFVPVILHASCILILNNIYRIVAEKLTSWENHETEVNYRNSLVLKRFLFEAFDCYIALFYLAFYERDVERLRMELIAVFQLDTFRRVFIECMLPILLKGFHAKSIPAQAKSSIKIPKYKGCVSDSISSLLEELDRESYEQFDDYMEIVIQLGYVTLFASAYPLASLIAIAANWVEIRADCFKLTRVCQRPIIYRAHNLGTWRTLMSCIIWASALTNCLIAGFTSDQLMQHLPTFYVHDASGYTDMGHDKGWLVVFVIFGLERLLLVVGLLIYAIVPEVPEDVNNNLERRQYFRFLEERVSTRQAQTKED